MKVFIGADHGGFELKEQIKPFLSSLGYKIVDVGNKKYDKEDDYPDFAYALGKGVSEGGGMGLLLCRSGAGMDMVSNKIRGVRSALVWNKALAKQAREHEDANVCCLAGDHLNFEEIKEIAKTFLETKFSEEERHKRRIKKMKEIEDMMGGSDCCGSGCCGGGCS